MAEPFANEPDLHLKADAKATRCTRCKSPLKNVRWTADRMYWEFATYNCEKRRTKQ